MLSILICLFILAVWLFAAAQHFLSAKKETGWHRLTPVLASLFLALGALGFFGTALSSTGGLNWLPKSFEWPVGSARGIVETTNHIFVVPHTPSGRIQLYDRNWKFIRGWHVDASGGVLDVFISEPGSINVVTARGRRHYIYSLDGKLISAERYPDNLYDSIPRIGISHSVPTAPWLWTFTSPFYSWLVAMLGMVMLIAKEKISSKSNGKK